MELASGTRRLSTLLTCWREQGVHFVEVGIVTALYNLAQPAAVRLLRSEGSRSGGVYNWLCVLPPLQATRHAALLVEPAFVANALCRRGAVTERLLKAVDARAPLRSIIMGRHSVLTRARFGFSIGWWAPEKSERKTLMSSCDRWRRWRLSYAPSPTQAQLSLRGSTGIGWPIRWCFCFPRA